MKDLNGHYCLATKEHYDRLVKDGYICTVFDKNYYHILIEYKEIDFYNPRDNDEDDLIPMHLHNNEWVFGSLEHEEYIPGRDWNDKSKTPPITDFHFTSGCKNCGSEMVIDDVCEDYYFKYCSGDCNENRKVYAKPKPVERITREEAIGELRQWAEKQCTWIDFYEFSGALDIYLEANQKENS